MNLQLSNKVALVTGSERGTGEIIAKTLAGEGARVVFHSNDEGLAAKVGCDLVLIQGFLI